MTGAVTTRALLDVESRGRDTWEGAYTGFLGVVHDLEQFLAAYLSAVFARRMHTHEALGTGHTIRRGIQ